MTTKKFKSLNNEEQEFVIRAFLKGAIHAVVVPVILYVVINILFEGNYGGITVLCYLTFAGGIYYFSNNKYFSKRGFIYALSFFGFWIVLYIFMTLLAAFVA